MYCIHSELKALIINMSQANEVPHLCNKCNNADKMNACWPYATLLNIHVRLHTEIQWLVKKLFITPGLSLV